MIDISTEKLITLAQAADKLQVSKASITRWIIHGTHGIRLEALKFGAYWRTSEEALQRFGESQTPTNLTSFSPSTSYKSFDRESPKRLREIEKACEELDEALGIRKCDACRKELDAGRVALPKNEKLWCPKCLVLRKSVTMGQRVRTFRWDAKLSQQALSKGCGISVDFIRALEENRKRLNLPSWSSSLANRSLLDWSLKSTLAAAYRASRLTHKSNVAELLVVDQELIVIAT